MLYNATCLLNYYRNKICDFNLSHDVPKLLYNEYNNESGCYYSINQPLKTFPNFTLYENISIYNLNDNFSVLGHNTHPIHLNPEKLYQFSCSQKSATILSCNIYREKYIGSVSLYYDRLPQVTPYLYGHIHNNSLIDFKLYSKEAIQSKPKFIKYYKSIEMKIIGNSIFINNDISFKWNNDFLKYFTIIISDFSNQKNPKEYNPRMIITIDGETQYRYNLDILNNNYSFSFNNRGIVSIKDKNVISIGRNISIRFEPQEMMHQNGFLAKLSINNVPGESIYNVDGSMDHQIHFPNFHQIFKFKNGYDLVIEDAKKVSITPNYNLIEPIYYSPD